MLHVFVKETAYFIKFLNPSNLKHKRCTMTEKTLLIFQLFLAIFTIYALLDHTCVFHAIPATDSITFRPPIPRNSGH